MTMLTELEKYYRGCGIWPANSSAFGCKHLDKCRRSCGKLLPFTSPDATELRRVQNTFTPGYSAFAGEEYGKDGGVPRLLFVALDLGSVLRDDDRGFSFVKPEFRTPRGTWRVRNRIMERLMTGTDTADATGKTIRRWTVEGTNQMAACILGKSAPEVMRCYAHVNAVKCTMNKKGRGQADGHLFMHCRNYLRGEIDILSPDIIVTHGGKARMAVEFAFRDEARGDLIEKHGCPNAFIINTRDGRRVFWLNAFHPSRRSWEKFQGQMRGENHGPKIKRKLRMESRDAPCGLRGYAKLIQKFMSTRASSPGVGPASAL